MNRIIRLFGLTAVITTFVACGGVEDPNFGTNPSALVAIPLDDTDPQEPPTCPDPLPPNEPPEEPPIDLPPQCPPEPEPEPPCLPPFDTCPDP